MYKDLVGQRVSFVVSSRGDNILEYTGTVSSENDEMVELNNVDISFIMLSVQKGFFGDNINMYKHGIEKVMINKKYIISCNK
jgi:hypothetical protein